MNCQCRCIICTSMFVDHPQKKVKVMDHVTHVLCMCAVAWCHCCVGACAGPGLGRSHVYEKGYTHTLEDTRRCVGRPMCVGATWVFVTNAHFNNHPRQGAPAQLCAELSILHQHGITKNQLQIAHMRQDCCMCSSHMSPNMPNFNLMNGPLP
jgi:hypothetical protein